jgi:hypothetical protein
MHAVEKKLEYRASLIVLPSVRNAFNAAGTVTEFVTKRHPLLFNQNDETRKGPIIIVQK